MVSHIPGIDGNTTKRLKRGKITLDRRIDLHGMFRDAARETVLNTLDSAWQQGERCVLVITGKGQVLREQLPGWLKEPTIAPHILALQEAAPEHGGSGAFYVLLRRRRT